MLLIYPIKANSGESPSVFQERVLDIQTLKNSISANRSLLERFQREYDQESLEKCQAPCKTAEDKLKNLRIKITVLINENERFVSMISNSPFSSNISYENFKDLRTEDWLTMRREDKELYIFSAMGSLIQRDVLTMKPSYFYIKALDRLTANSSYFKNEKLDDLLILCVYKNEPDARKPIETFRKISPDGLKKLNLSEAS